MTACQGRKLLTDVDGQGLKNWQIMAEEVGTKIKICPGGKGIELIEGFR